MKNIIFILILSFTNLFAQKPEKKAISYSYYHITAENLNINIVNSYPQKVTKYISKEKPYEIIIKTFSAYQDYERRKLIESQPFEIKYNYPGNIKKYLESTSLIESNSPRIKSIADSLVNYKLSMIENVKNILKWVSNYIEFDKELARKISDGKSQTQSALITLDRKKGTCSEYTNLFIAIMRNLGIPTKFIVGVIYFDDEHTMYHAWAEYYWEDIGWIGVDPQNAQIWLPNNGIKLFAGKDFIDCNIDRLLDIKATVTRYNDN